jgi:hypothetical protein
VSARRECDYCHNAAFYRVEAQWTVFDFDFDFVCRYHWRQSVRRFEVRYVDGQPVKGLFVRRIDDGALFAR